MAEAEKKLVEVRAKMSGVFYRKPSPDQPPYVEIGIRREEETGARAPGDDEGLPEGEVSGERRGRSRSPPKTKWLLKDDDLMFVIEAG